MIYFIQAGADGPVKIGYASDVSKRLATLQAGNHARFKVLRTMDGGREIERRLHHQFKVARIDREWFKLDAEMLTFEFPAPQAETPSPPPEPRGIFDAWLEQQHFRDAEIARRLGVSQATIHHLRRGNRIPSLKLAHKIAVLTRDKVAPGDWPPVRRGAKGDAA